MTAQVMMILFWFATFDALISSQFDDAPGDAGKSCFDSTTQSSVVGGAAGVSPVNSTCGCCFADEHGQPLRQCLQIVGGDQDQAGRKSRSRSAPRSGSPRSCGGGFAASERLTG
ncbi:hypothetical protein [Mesorhizobium dulcispinae]|uniref:hypothetical protein n=1 Tax=Mesorhizobium dulcispinae TaxID=3072316 RepID=UPI002A24AEBC|nr:hypothetical protein [Mesorhizobium sp. VK23D]MDX8520327.1 hypothetical protein [Mesorhizobium sp. VK23D]